MPDFIKHDLGSGVYLMGEIIGDMSREECLKKDVQGYQFGSPMAHGGDVGPPIRVAKDDAVVKQANKSPTRAAWWTSIQDRSQEIINGTKGLFVGYRMDQDASTARDLSGAYLRRLSIKIAKLLREKHLPSFCGPTIYLYMPDVLVADAFGPSDNLIHGIASAFRSGYIPIQWVGAWPKGYLHVYCPKGLDQRLGTEVDGAIEDREDMERKQELQRRHREHPGYISAPAIACDCYRQWVLLANDPAHTSLLSYWKPLTQNEGDQLALKAVLKRVARVEATSRALRIHVRDGDGSMLVLRCDPPWLKSASHMPQDLVSVLRMHNGMTLEEPAEAISMFRYNGKRFVSEDGFGELDDRNPVLMEEPWSMAPVLMPMTDGQNVYAYDPVQYGTNGRAVLKRISHEISGVNTDTKTGLFGTFIRCVAERLHAQAKQ